MIERQLLRSFDLGADGGIGGLKRKLRARGGAPADPNEREHGKETAKRSPAIGHALLQLLA
jgi:hypothetical protein